MTRPELLAPAGDEDCLNAALAAGADAVYFGLSEGLNARARATNFPLERLPETVDRIHRGGARAYLALNTLVFDAELSAVERTLRAAVASGVDALLVQDPAVALLAREVAPGIERHASTQMTLSSPGALRVARDLGLRRVILPRELSIEDIEILKRGTDLELEVFVHGALCVSWSGQCLTSEAWGGRSANRGQCAQACRLPYELIVNGRPHDTGDAAYLLSPKDLAAWSLLPRLVRAGVAAFKIEGRQKGAGYVATAVRAYREALDRAMQRVTLDPEGSGDAAAEPLLDPAHVEAMGVAFSRGFCTGFLAGVDHQALVDGHFPGHRGLPVGRVERVSPPAVIVHRGADRCAVKRGDGIVFDGGRSEEAEEGGAVFDAQPAGEGRLLLRFGRPGPDLGRVRPGMRVWKTSDPAVLRETRRLIAAREPARRPVHLVVSGQAGQPLRVIARCDPRQVEARSASALAPARGVGLDEPLLAEKLGRLGGTSFRLESVDASGLAPGLHLPVSELNELRRQYAAALEEELTRRPARVEGHPGALERLLGRAGGGAMPGAGGRPAVAAAQIIPLCRTDEQLDAVLDLGCGVVELDWMEMAGLERAVGRARARGAEVVLATLRVQKPGEEALDRRIAGLEPDGILVRHWGALEFFRSLPAGQRPRLHGDFSLNLANQLSARFLLDRGLETVTPAHDLDRAEVETLVSRVDPARITIVLHHHIATFHTEYCVIARFLSQGDDFRSCGRPCEAHAVSLRDRTGEVHPVVVDAGCRNTMFNARAQTAAGAVPGLLEAGVRRFRVEFVRETAAEVRGVLESCRALPARRG